MNRTKIGLLALGIGLGLGFYFGGSKDERIKTLGILVGGGLIGSSIVSFVNYQVTTRKTNQFLTEINDLKQSKSELETKFTTIDKARLDSERAKELALKDVARLETKTEILTNQIEKLEQQNNNYTPMLEELRTVKSKLVVEVEKLSNSLQVKEDLIVNLQAQLEEYKENFASDVAEQASDEAQQLYLEKKEQVIMEEIKIDDQLTSEALQLCHDYRQFIEGIIEQHFQHHDLLLATNDKAKQHFDKLQSDNNAAYSALLAEKENLELKVQQLNLQIGGELIKPSGIPGKVGWGWTMANMLLDKIYQDADIPLKLTGIDESLPDGYILAVFAYSKSANPQTIIETIKPHFERWAKNWGINFVGDAKTSVRYPVIEIKMRRDKPLKDNTESIYKEGLIPAKLFGDTLYRAMTHGSKGKPTLRIMASTGDGKGITGKNMLAYFLQLEGWELWLSDPVSGSDEDYWDCSKVAINRTEARVAYSNFYKLYNDRKTKKVSTTPKILAVFDEFDSEHSEEQHEQAKEVMGRMRHVGMHQILIGQSAEVGKNSWTWDDMKNCALLVLEGSIGTLRKHLVPDLGWTVQKKNKLGKEYDRYRKWADEQNKANPDVPNENQIRLGLLIVGDRYEFLEIPVAHKGILRSTPKVNIKTTLDVTNYGVVSDTLSQKPNLKSIMSGQNTALQSNDPLTAVSCIHCQSINLRKAGKDKQGNQRYECKDCQHKPRRWSI